MSYLDEVTCPIVIGLEYMPMFKELTHYLVSHAGNEEFKLEPYACPFVGCIIFMLVNHVGICALALWGYVTPSPSPFMSLIDVLWDECLYECLCRMDLMNAPAPIMCRF